MTTVRIDKWLWAVRVFKTRNQAADACRGGKVKVDGQKVKPSKEVKEGDVVEIQQGIFKKKLQIKKATKNRVSAKFVPDLAEDLTPAEEYEKMQLLRQLNYEKRDRGAGRPTKKERRKIERLKGEE
ncbi:MAG: RNA-binding S4 domain-containing protein [Chlorobi bacterium]|nr:RNA-binding S4 domain-containing protein [Chlorobiota bacterium]